MEMGAEDKGVMTMNPSNMIDTKVIAAKATEEIAPVEEEMTTMTMVGVVARNRLAGTAMEDEALETTGGDVSHHWFLQGQALTVTLAESHRSYSSDSSVSSISPRRAYKHRKSLGEQALAALGLGGVLGAEKEKDRERRSSRERRSDRDRAYRREDRDRGYGNGTKALPAGYLGYNERQQRYNPDGSNTGAVATRNGYAGSQGTVDRRNGDFQNARGRRRESSSDSSSESSSDVISSSEEDRRQKKMKGKEFLTAGLVSSSHS